MDKDKLEEANKKFEALKKKNGKSEEKDDSSSAKSGIPDKDMRKFLGCGG